MRDPVTFIISLAEQSPTSECMALMSMIQKVKKRQQKEALAEAVLVMLEMSSPKEPATEKPTRKVTVGGIGEYVRQYREKNELSQKNLGELVGFSGAYIGAIETGAMKPSENFNQAFQKLSNAPATVVQTNG